MSCNYNTYVSGMQTAPEQQASEPQLSTPSVSTAARDERKNSGTWDPEEHQKFLSASPYWRDNWERVAEIVGSRTDVQCRTHYQKYRMPFPAVEVGEQAAGAGAHAKYKKKVPQVLGVPTFEKGQADFIQRLDSVVQAGADGDVGQKMDIAVDAASFLRTYYHAVPLRISEDHWVEWNESAQGKEVLQTIILLRYVQLCGEVW